MHLALLFLQNVFAKRLLLPHLTKDRSSVKGLDDAMIIDLRDASSDTSSETHTSNVWVEHPTGRYRLYTSDRDILLNSKEWLTDSIITAAQILLKDQHPVAGLQPPCLGQMYNFAIQKGEFMQVLHDGSGHWLTVSTVGASMEESEVFVFNSLFGGISNTVKLLVASIMHIDNNYINFKVFDVQRQDGVDDCGLFAIAFAAAVVLGFSPGQFLFQQHRMRQHLFQCLQEGKLSMFPIAKERRTGLHRRIKEVSKVPVFCVCRMPDTGSKMVACSGCKAWFHEACLSIPSPALQSKNMPWFCPECSSCTRC